MKPLGRAGARKSDLVWVHAHVYTKYPNQEGDGAVIYSPAGEGVKKELFRVAYDVPILGLSCGHCRRQTGHIRGGWLSPDKFHVLVRVQLMRLQRWETPIECLEEDLEFVDLDLDTDTELGRKIREEVEFVYGDSGARGLEAVVLELNDAGLVQAANLVGIISRILGG